MTILLDNQFAYVTITPVKVSFIDSTNATRLYIASVNDDLHSQCTLNYDLTDDNHKSLLKHSLLLNGTDYTNWNGDNSFPFTFVAANIPGGPLTITS